MKVHCQLFYFSAFVLVLALLPLTEGTSLPCHELLTSVVRGIEKRGRLIADGISFDSPNFVRLNKTHFRVCVCTKIPCLRKCCPKGKVYINRTCQPYYFDIHPKVFNEHLELIPNFGVENFHRVYGDTCSSGMFKLSPEYLEEKYYLLYNGTLRLPYDNMGRDYETSEFCFENVLNNMSRSDEKLLQAFVCFFPEPYNTDIFYPIGMIISIPFLLATFIVYSLPELRNLHGKNLMSEVAALLIAYVVLVVVQFCSGIINNVVCIVLGFTMQYAFLATFFWLNVMCFDIWSTFSGFGRLSSHIREKERKRFILYSCYAWGIPMFISMVTAAFEYAPNLPDFIIRPHIGTKKCFFETKQAHFAYFYGPAAVVVVADIVFFTLTAVKIYRVRKETKVLSQNESRRTDEASKQRYYLYLKLFLVMGISWVMEIISWSVQGPKELWYLTDAMNSLQGLFIFWIFVCSRKIKKVLKSRFCPRQAARDSETNTSSLKMTTSGNSDNTILGNSFGFQTNKRKTSKILNSKV